VTGRYLGLSAARRRALVAVTIAVAVVSSGCASDESRPSIEEIADAVSPACRGERVAEAGEDAPISASPAKLVLLQEDGRPHAWAEEIPSEWSPATVAEVGLVVCAQSEVQYHEIEVCPYLGGPDITRYTAVLGIRLVAPHTGEVMLEEELRAFPRHCQAEEHAELTRLAGQLGAAELTAALAPFVEGRTASVEIIAGAHLAENASRALSPAELTVPVGTLVRWTNHDSEYHRLVRGDGTFWFDLFGDEGFSFEFTEAGTYPYYCSVYPYIHGMVIVTG